MPTGPPHGIHSAELRALGATMEPIVEGADRHSAGITDLVIIVSRILDHGTCQVNYRVFGDESVTAVGPEPSCFLGHSLLSFRCVDEVNTAAFYPILKEPILNEGVDGSAVGGVLIEPVE